ncbi:MAG: hypothetical protein ABW202_06495 [Duganella sp.]
MNSPADKPYIDARHEAVLEHVDGRVNTFMARMDGRFAETYAKIDTLGADLRRDMADSTTRIVQWTVSTFIATVAIFMTMVAFMFNNAQPKTSSPAAGNVPAVVVTVSPQNLKLEPPPASAPPAR